MKGRITRFALAAAVALAVLLAPISTKLAAAQPEPPRTRSSSRFVRGEVVAVGERALAIRGARGLGLVITNEETVLRIPELENPSLDELSVGNQIAALGRGRGRLFGARVLAVETDAELTRLAGQVTAVDGTTITLSPRSDGPVSVFTDPDTIFHIPNIEAPGVEDIEVDMLVEAVGFLDGDDFQAFVISSRRSERRARLTGQVSGVEEDSFSMEIRGGRQITLTVDAETSLHVPDVEDASLADVPVGERVSVEVEAPGGAPRARTVVVWLEDPARVGGTVIAIEGATLKLETERGEVEAITDATTLVRIPDVEAPSLADIQPGDRVLCAGSWEDETTFSALVVAVRRPATERP